MELSQVILTLAILNQPCLEADVAVAQLDSSMYAKRTLAGKVILKLGQRALPALEYEERHGSLEAKRRSRLLIEAIYERFDDVPPIANLKNSQLSSYYDAGRPYHSNYGTEIYQFVRAAQIVTGYQYYGDPMWRLATQIKAREMFRLGVPMWVIQKWFEKLRAIERNWTATFKRFQNREENSP